MMESPLSFLHIASVIGIFKKSAGQRYALLQRTVLGFFNASVGEVMGH